MLRTKLTKGLQALDISLEPAAIDKLLVYVELMARWNKTYNLTAVREPDQMISRHLLDSLALLPWLAGESLLDVGSGAGLPGVPLAIARPELQVTLLDSLGKRCRFLRQVRRELGLENIKVVEARAEDWQSESRPAMITARAVAALPLLLEQTGHLFAADTRMLAAKGRWPEAELAEIPEAFKLQESVKLNIPGVAAERHLLVITRK